MIMIDYDMYDVNEWDDRKSFVMGIGMEIAQMEICW